VRNFHLRFIRRNGCDIKTNAHFTAEQRRAPLFSLIAGRRIFQPFGVRAPICLLHVYTSAAAGSGFGIDALRRAEKSASGTAERTRTRVAVSRCEGFDPRTRMAHRRWLQPERRGHHRWMDGWMEVEWLLHGERCTLRDA
jgi:hypothetical protein